MSPRPSTSTSTATRPVPPAAPRPSPSTPPAPTRLMLARPETLDVVGGLERIECLDLPAKLSRAACAHRYTAAQKATPGPQGAVQRLAAGPCCDCPVGKLHAAEQRAGKLAHLTVVGTDRRLRAAPKPEGANGAPAFRVPEAVVPARRGSVRPATPKTPDPSGQPPVGDRRRGPASIASADLDGAAKTPGPDHADAQQGSAVGRIAGGAARSGPRERTSPVEADAVPPVPPTVEPAPVSAGRRPRGVGRPFAGRLLRHPITGEEMPGVQWAEKLGISQQLISWRLGKGLPMERVLAPHRCPKIAAGVSAARRRDPVERTAIEPSRDATPATITCCDCGESAPRTSNRQRRCPACRRKQDLAGSREAKRAARRQAGVPERRAPAQAPERPPTVETPSPVPAADTGHAGAPATTLGPRALAVLEIARRILRAQADVRAAEAELERALA